MAVPLTVPIRHEPGYRTDTIGRFADGQFLAGVTAAFREDFHGADQWEPHKRWYAYLHRFDRDGHHLSSDIRFTGTTADGEREVVARAEQELANLLAGLPDKHYCDVAIQLFQTTVDGVLFGLVDETDDEFGERAELYPDELGFGPPWDGEYDT
ncbi:hypothetical protein AB0M46_15470 [Dactylosporangium sp. NPDC051485]|uniref:hypothetical protein n=1 Tax=Dactylosporangium sp. NPDC051485 TaxID=3154846 RepID=UPI00343CFB8D